MKKLVRMRDCTLDILLKDFVEQASIAKLKNITINNLCLNSLHLNQGECFFAYPGYSKDGRDYINEAIAKGAAAVVYDPIGYSSINEQSNPIPIIPLPHLADKMGLLAARFYQEPTANIPVIGVTGTNGKTSISHCLTYALQFLKAKYAVLGTLGNGFLPNLTRASCTTLDPISLQRQCSEYRDLGAEGFVLEVSSHGLAQKRVAGIHFTHGILTNLTRDHLDYHGSMQAYGAAKKRLFLDYDLQYAILNADDYFASRVLAKLPARITPFLFSLKNSDDRIISAQHLIPTAEGMKAQILSPWGKGELTIPLIGEFNVSNSLAVIATLMTLGYDWDAVLTAVSQVPLIKGRMERLRGGDNQPQVVVDFAHTPDALWKALATLKTYCEGHLWVVFGCGGERDEGKRAEMGRIAQQWSDHIILTNDNPRTEDPNLIVQDILQGITTGNTPIKIILDRAQAIQHALSHAQAKDWILIAGKGHENYQLIGKTSLPFQDQTVVREYFNHQQPKVNH